MVNIVKIAMMLVFIAGSCIFSSFDAQAQITHVSINQQLFTLGEHPKFRMNIVSDKSNYKKMQFIVQQGDSEEILIVKPINKFLLEAIGVEDVNDPSAVLVIKEYRVNKWRNVKSLPLFSGDARSKNVAVKAKPLVLRNEVKVKQNRLVELQVSKSGEILTDPNCSLESLLGQTLWKIALQYRKEWRMTTYGAVVAIFEANPKAFSANNVSSLKADSQLFCPSNAVKDKYRDSQLAQDMYKELLD